MKTVLAALLALVAAGASQPPAAPSAQGIDPNRVNYTMSTIADRLPAMAPGRREVAASDFLLHEDEWRQIEFFPASRTAEIQRILSAIKRSSEANRTAAGWRDIYARRVPDGLVLAGPDALGGIAREMGGTAAPGPVVHRGEQAPIGRVAGGFTIPLGPGVMLYGIGDASGVSVLAASLDQAGDAHLITTAFTRLNARYGLILVDWRAQMLLIRATDGDNIEVWEP